MNRRSFVKQIGTATAGVALVTNPLSSFGMNGVKKKRIILVGTGIRGISMFGTTILNNFEDAVEYVGLCDINPGRLEYAKSYMGVNCPVYTDFDLMLKETNPDYLIVTTEDSNHDEFIIKGLEYGVDVITEKPITTDEHKAARILEAESKSNNKVIVALNYRWGQPFWRLKELLENKRIGELLTIDFSWYLNIYHGASYFRRWHAYTENSGTLLVHKSTHHFDLLNWWVNSDPEEVFAYGGLDYYGKNGKFSGKSCRSCAYKKECSFYWDITENEHLMNLYVKNEEHDGYIRDSCVFREDIDIYDNMGVQIKYKNGVKVNYSLNAYLPYEGHRIAFNGTKGRIENEDGIPWLPNFHAGHGQEEIYKREMNQSGNDSAGIKDIIHVTEQFKAPEKIEFPFTRSGHWGGDIPLLNNIFNKETKDDPLRRPADSRGGVMAVLIGVAARKSIKSGKPIQVDSLTDLKLKETLY